MKTKKCCKNNFKKYFLALITFLNIISISVGYADAGKSQSATKTAAALIETIKNNIANNDRGSNQRLLAEAQKAIVDQDVGVKEKVTLISFMVTAGLDLGPLGLAAAEELFDNRKKHKLDDNDGAALAFNLFSLKPDFGRERVAVLQKLVDNNKVNKMVASLLATKMLMEHLDLGSEGIVVAQKLIDDQNVYVNYRAHLLIRMFWNHLDLGPRGLTAMQELAKNKDVDENARILLAEILAKTEGEAENKNIL